MHSVFYFEEKKTRAPNCMVKRVGLRVFVPSCLIRNSSDSCRFEEQTISLTPSQFAIGADGDGVDLEDWLQNFGVEVGLIDKEAQMGHLFGVDGELGEGHGDEGAVFDEPAVGEA